MVTELNFATFIEDLQAMGFYDYFLPFILIFSITFALLENSKILGKDQRNINIVVSMVIGFILIAQQSVVAIINTFLQKSSLIIIVILISLLIIFLIGGKGWFEGKLFSIGFILVIIALIWALSPSLGLDTPVWLNISDRTKNLVILLFLFAIVTLLLTSKKDPAKGNILSRILDDINLGAGGGRDKK